MGATLIGFVIGLALGAGTGTAFGAFALGAVGMSIGLVVHALLWMRSNLGDNPTVEAQRVMCPPLGHAANLQLEGDLKTGRWFAVKSCSLLEPCTQIDCDKGCLRQINLAGVRPGRAPGRPAPSAS